MKKMSNERYNQIIDEAYENYLEKMVYHPEENWLDDGDGKKTYRQLKKQEFISKLKHELIQKYIDKGYTKEQAETTVMCKTDPEFSKRWGLKIEERELSLEERRKLANYESEFVSPMTVESWDRNNIPTKLITVTYKDEKIEFYE